MTDRTVVFKGASGRQYKYYVHPKGALFVGTPGNYCFGKELNGTITPLYFGESENLKARNCDNEHERGSCAAARGWNVTCAHTSPNSKFDRCAEETDLRRAYDPPCNRQ